VSFHQELRGRPGSATRYRRSEKPVFTITAVIRADNVAYDAATDGCFPTITNDIVMTPAEVLAAYQYQPNLERRHHMLKGPQDVAPVYLETPHRIEALLLCHFLAMLVEALIEREIRTSMKTQGLAGIPLGRVHTHPCGTRPNPVGRPDPAVQRRNLQPCSSEALDA
jgi:transposase